MSNAFTFVEFDVQIFPSILFAACSVMSLETWAHTFVVLRISLVTIF